MANDTDLLTSNDCEDPSSCHNGDIERRQASLVSLGMSSGAQNLASAGSSATSGEKLDPYVANGCVKLHEGLVECQDVTRSVVCHNVNATAIRDDEEVVKFTQNSLCDDYQHSTANGFVPPKVDDRADQLTDDVDNHSHQSVDISRNYTSAAADHASLKFPPETFSADIADKPDLVDSDEQLNANVSSSCACGLQQTAIADLSGLSIVDEDSVKPRVPCDDSVATQSDAKESKIRYIVYESERQMEAIMQLITKDLSEPYSIYTYRYFIHNWPKLCYLVGI